MCVKRNELVTSQIFNIVFRRQKMKHPIIQLNKILERLDQARTLVYRQLSSKHNLTRSG